VNILTIVVMTRDRIDLLKKALASVFERQSRVPQVIVTDNSIREHAEMEILQRQYGFSYVRQSGRLSPTEHHNVCLTLVTTRWVWLLHDDDELYPNAVARVEACLEDCEDVGIFVGGVEDITHEGEVIRHWLPRARGILKGDAALGQLGLDWGVRAPSQVFSVRESLKIGGFVDAVGYPADVAFACTLAYSYGVRFHQEVIGRSRTGNHQTSFVKDNNQIKNWFLFHGRQVELIRSLNCATQVAERIADYLVWSVFLQYARIFMETKPLLMCQLARHCVEFSPRRGEWNNRTRKHFPFLFWGLGPIAWPLYRVVRKSRYLWERLFRNTGVLHNILPFRGPTYLKEQPKSRMNEDFGADMRHEALMVRTPDGTIRYWDKGAQQLYGWVPQEALGERSHRLLKTIFPKPLQSIEKDLIEKGHWEGQLVHTRRDGSDVRVASRWELQRNAEDQSRVVIEINRQCA
jgi:PAS domain-containing protein